VKAALQEMDSEHPLQTYRRTTFTQFGVEGFDEGIEFLPGNDPLHFGEELFPLHGLFVFFEGGSVSERFLAFHRSSSSRMVLSRKLLIQQRIFTSSKSNLPETFSEIL